MRKNLPSPKNRYMKADFGIMINNHIEKIKNSLFAIAPGIFSKHPVLFAYLYGSYATGIVHFRRPAFIKP